MANVAVVEPLIVLVGGDSAIGRQLMLEAQAQGIDVLASTRRPSCVGPERFFLDLTAPAGKLALPEGAGPVIIAAAQTGSEACASDPLSAIANVAAPVELARQAIAAGRRVLFISSSAVFDGSRPSCGEDDAMLPVGDYGRQKAEAERRLRDLPGWESHGAVVRLTKVISSATSPFRAWQEMLDTGHPIAPLADLLFAPISLRFAAASLLRIGMSAHGGVLHLSGAADLSYADFARRWVHAQGLDAALVQGRSAGLAGMGEMHRPRHAALGMARTEALTGIRAQHIDSVVSEMAAAGRLARPGAGLHAPSMKQH